MERAILVDDHPLQVKAWTRMVGRTEADIEAQAVDILGEYASAEAYVIDDRFVAKMKSDGRQEVDAGDFGEFVPS